MTDSPAPGPGGPDRTGGRVVWLVTSPRTPAGLLSWPAWEALRGADVVLATDPAHPLRPYVEAAEVRVETITAADPAAYVIDLARGGADVVWLAGEDDSAAADRLGQLLAADTEAGAQPPELEVLIGAYDPPGARLLDLVAVMDRLRSQCPWDREQTHRSLVRYLLEETYETIEALEAGSAADVREELGDLLFQAFFHARIAEEDPDEPWSIDDLAGGVVDKLVRRHPHVFAEVEVADAAEVAVNWEAIKATEKPRTSPLEGVPRALPALALGDKVLGRFAKTGTDVDVPAAGLPTEPSAEQIGAALLAVVAAARRADVDPEQALRDAVRRLIADHG